MFSPGGTKNKLAISDVIINVTRGHRLGGWDVFYDTEPFTQDARARADPRKINKKWFTVVRVD